MPAGFLRAEVIIARHAVEVLIARHAVKDTHPELLSCAQRLKEKYDQMERFHCLDDQGFMIWHLSKIVLWALEFRETHMRDFVSSFYCVLLSSWNEC